MKRLVYRMFTYYIQTIIGQFVIIVPAGLLILYIDTAGENLFLVPVIIFLTIILFGYWLKKIFPIGAIIDFTGKNPANISLTTRRSINNTLIIGCIFSAYILLYNPLIRIHDYFLTQPQEHKICYVIKSIYV